MCRLIDWSLVDRDRFVSCICTAHERVYVDDRELQQSLCHGDCRPSNSKVEALATRFFHRWPRTGSWKRFIRGHPAAHYWTKYPRIDWNYVLIPLRARILLISIMCNSKENNPLTRAVWRRLWAPFHVVLSPPCCQWCVTATTYKHVAVILTALPSSLSNDTWCRTPHYNQHISISIRM